MKMNIKYFEKVLKFYSSGFIFSLGCASILTVWFATYPSTNGIEKVNLFWINAIFYSFCLMFGLGWIFLIDDVDKEREKK